MCAQPHELVCTTYCLYNVCASYLVAAFRTSLVGLTLFICAIHEVSTMLLWPMQIKVM